MIQVTGTNKQPNGVAKKLKVRIVCLSGTGDILQTTPVVIETGSDGVYDFNIVNGDFSIEVFNDKQWNLLGSVRVADGATSPATINQLIDNNPIPES